MTADLRERLAAPFPADVIGWKPQSIKNNRALAVAYIDARDVQNRLDETVGPENWWATYDVLGEGARVVCHLTILWDARPVTKTDVGGESEQSDAGDRLKAAFSDALKRAAVQWGIGRYLYSLPATWCDLDERNQIRNPPKLPAWALPAAEKDKPAPPADPRRAALSEAMKAAGWSWTDAVVWLNDTYPAEPPKYTPTTRFAEVEPERVDHLTRFINTASVAEK